MQIKNNWRETIERFDAWFHHKPTDRPLMNIWVKRNENEKIAEPLPEEPFTDSSDMYLNTDKQFARIFNLYTQNVYPMAEAFPDFSMNLGAGSMALYLGSEPTFTPETVWFKPFLDDYSQELKFDPDNIWWQKHLAILLRMVELAKDTDISICIPDIVENMDILSAIRDPQLCCLDLYDNPEGVKKTLDAMTKYYPMYYNAMHDIVKRPDNSSAFTAFSVIGSGKTAKIQCDFAALMSPEHFKEFAIPGLRDQCSWIDNTVFHLDGPECFPHVKPLMEIERLGALQWTPGARNPRAGEEIWFDMYAQVKEAGKGLWISLADYPPEEAIARAKKITKKFGRDGLYFLFPVMEREQAEQLMLFI